MTRLTASTHLWDRLAIGVSGLCLVHCIATTVIVAMVSSIGGIFGSHLVHEVGLGIAMMLGSFALGRGILEHGFMLPSAVGGLGLGVMAGSLSLHDHGGEVAATMIGVLILALGHDLNRRGTTHSFGRR